MLAPSDRLSSVNTRSCFVTRPSIGDVVVFDTVGAVTDAGFGFARGDACASSQGLLRAERLDFGDVSMEGVDMLLGSVGMRRRD
jgi:hypothetical protein